MQNLSPAVRSGGVLAAGVSLALALAASTGCRPDDMPADAADMAMPSDLALSSLKSTTIRELNTPMGNIKVGDRVHLTGVVVSPRTWVTFDDKVPNWCYYRLILMQADGSPTTIRDGLAVTLSIKSPLGDMSHVTECANLAKTDPVGMAMMAAKTGEQLELEGKFSTRGSGASATRQLDVYKGLITNKGAAQIMPVPLDADPMTYQPAMTGLAPAFADAQGVLVTFKNVKINTRDMMYQDFNVSTTDMGGARIATNFLRVANSGYMSPMNGTVLKSITGIVTGDFKGTIWPTGDADIVQ